MSNRNPNDGSGTQRISEEIHTAHKVHTLVQMIYRQLSTGLSARPVHMPSHTVSPPPQQAPPAFTVSWPQFQGQQPVLYAQVPVIATQAVTVGVQPSAGGPWPSPLGHHPLIRR